MLNEQLDTNAIIVQAVDECVLFRLRWLTRQYTHTFDNALKAAGIKSTQFSILIAAELLGPINQTEFSKIMAMEKSTLSRNIGVLIDKGVAESRPGIEDKRSREITLTRKGKKLLADAAPLWKEQHEKLKQSLSEEQWNTVFSAFRILSALQD